MLISLFEALGSRENIPIWVAFAVLLTLALAWIAPAEATLGEAVKLVYIHAALMWVGFGLLTISAGLGALYIIWRREGLLKWSKGGAVTGVALLLGTGLLGILTAKITWGGVFWAEPRLAMLGEILLVGLLAIGIGRFSASKTLCAATNIALGAVAWILVIRTERVIHPVSPIFTSESTAIKMFPLLITATLAFAGLQITRYLTTSEQAN